MGTARRSVFCVHPGRICCSDYDAFLSAGYLEVTQTSGNGFQPLVSEPIMNPGRLDIVTASAFPTNVNDTVEYVKKFPSFFRTIM